MFILIKYNVIPKLLQSLIVLFKHDKIGDKVFFNKTVVQKAWNCWLSIFVWKMITFVRLNT